jgi:hypothetical protein
MRKIDCQAQSGVNVKKTHAIFLGAAMVTL